MNLDEKLDENQDEKKSIQILVTIKNSPFEFFLYIDDVFTVGDMKKLILEKYNFQQTTSHLPLCFSQFGKKFDFKDDSVKISSLGKVDYLDIVNENIQYRLGHLKPFEVVKSAHFAHFHHDECDETEVKKRKSALSFPSRTTSRILTFDVCGQFKDKSVLIKFHKKQMLNWRSGPTCAQYYYRLYPNGSAGVYYAEGIVSNSIYKKYQKFFPTVEHFLLTDVYEICTGGRPMRWDFEPELCDVCTDQVPNVLFQPCDHVRVCDSCCAKLTKCTQCNQNVLKLSGINYVGQYLNI